MIASALGPPVTVVVSDVWSVLTQKMEGSPSKFPDRCGKIQGSQVPPLPRAPQDLHGAPGGENGERPCGRTDPSWTWEKWRSDEAFLVTVSASSVHSRGYYTIVLNLLSRIQSYIYYIRVCVYYIILYIHIYVYIYIHTYIYIYLYYYMFRIMQNLNIYLLFYIYTHTYICIWHIYIYTYLILSHSYINQPD